jgi:hypothetical protein
MLFAQHDDVVQTFPPYRSNLDVAKTERLIGRRDKARWASLLVLFELQDLNRTS